MRSHSLQKTMATVTDLLRFVSRRPMDFVTGTELLAFCPDQALYSQVIARDLANEMAAPERYPSDLTYLNKMVLGRDRRGQVFVFLTAGGPLHRSIPLALTCSIDPSRLVFGHNRHIKGEFVAPTQGQFAYLATFGGQLLALGDRIPGTGLRARSWQFVIDERGVHVDVLAEDGALYAIDSIEAALERETLSSLVYRPVSLRLPGGLEAHDIVTVPSRDRLEDLVIATSDGLYWHGAVVRGTQGHDLRHLSLNVDSMSLVAQSASRTALVMWLANNGISQADEVHEDMLGENDTESFPDWRPYAGSLLERNRQILVTAWRREGDWLTYFRRKVPVDRMQPCYAV